MLPEYRPEPYVDFSQEGPRTRMIAALKSVGGQLGQSYPLEIAGEKITTKQTVTSVAPAHFETVVGRIAEATEDHADKAIAAAAAAFPAWSRTEPEARARIMFRAAARMRERLYELTAWECFEESKSWIEGYADVCEAIDFLDYYGREMMTLGRGKPLCAWPGEENEYRYMPLGVCAVIPPWNFPLAICTGMTASCLVTGNTVVLKPARQSPVLAALMVDIFREVGLPPGVLNFVPGEPTVVGRRMVDDPRTRLVSFTGSRKVGTEIYERSAKVHDGQKWLKRCILEMGGKDCIVVDETADLEAAAAGAVAAGYGFQGQKCSACSRLIVHQDVHDELLERVVKGAKQISIGDTTSEANFFMGSVIDETAQNKSNSYIEIGKKEGTLVLGEPITEPALKQGYFVKPHIFKDIKPDARLAQEEIFGPVLAVIKVRNFDEGLAVANGTDYGLTGALFSRERDRLERARHEFHCGNLYFNRKCTGALVGVQPFGGFNMSGTDSKAGGPDYLTLFMQAKTVTERL